MSKRLLCTRPCAKSVCSLCHLVVTTTMLGECRTGTSVFQVKTQKLRELKTCVQGQAVSKRQWQT